MFNKPKIIFFGSDEFSAIVLKKLKEAGFELQVTSYKLQDADLGVVASYGKIISKKVLDSFRYGVLNVHPSLLPKYRGPSPIQTAIVNGDTGAGVTIMKLNDKIDEGDIVANEELRIKNNEMYSQLRNRLAELGAELLIKVIPDYIADKIMLRPQNHAQATYTKMLTREDGKVDLKKDSPEQIYRKFRAYEGWPGIWILHKGRRVKILDCGLENDNLKILQLQPEGKKPMSMLEYINGYGKLANS